MDHRFSRRELARSMVAPTARRRAAPAALATVSFEQHLLSRATFGRNDWCTAELQMMGTKQWLERQLQPMTIDDPIELSIGTVVDPTSSTGPDIRMLARAIHSRRQLAWRMVHFLNNHFS